MLPWLKQFILPSLLSIGITYLTLRLLFRRSLQGSAAPVETIEPLSPQGRAAAWSILLAGALLIFISARGLDLGLPTCAAALVAVPFVTRTDGRAIMEIIRGVSWRVLPLVAALFIVVEALQQAGALERIGFVFSKIDALPRPLVPLTGSFLAAAVSNLMNNLPCALLTGGALHATQVSKPLHSALLIGIDLGPNLSITGSLASLLWLIALRREGISVSAWTFLKNGAIVMTPALLLAALALASGA